MGGNVYIFLSRFIKSERWRMRKVVGPDFGVKASGGIKTLNDALAMIQSGANRLGTSSGIKIISEITNR